jgi:hypothetical protein
VDKVTEALNSPVRVGQEAATFEPPQAKETGKWRLSFVWNKWFKGIQISKKLGVKK